MDNNDIGKVFKEKLNNLNESPPNHIWDNILLELDKKENKKRIIPFWYFGVASSVAIFLILFGVVNKYYNSKNNKQIVNIKESIINKTPLTNDENERDLITYKETKKENQNSKEVIKNKADVKKMSTRETKLKLAYNNSDNDTSTKSVNNNNSINKTNIHIQTKSINHLKAKTTTIKNSLVFSFVKMPSINKGEIPLINKNTIVTTRRNKWKAYLKTSPIYYSSFNNGSSISSEFENNKKNSNLTYSYGISTSVNLTDNINFRTGISTIELAYNTEKATANSLLDSQSIILSDNNYFFTDIDSAFTPLEDNIFELTQRINYIEVPFEFSYKLIDRKVDINIITGMSTLFLTNNNVLKNNKEKIGSVNNLNKLSFTGNLGLGFDYKITKRINLSVEPIIKLQLNTYNKSVNYKPYYFGAYSGFVYKF